MRYKKCKLVCGLMVCVLMMTSVTACGTNTTESSTETESTTEANTFAYTDGTEEELVSTTVMAKVDSVDGNAQQTPGEMTQASALITINDESVIKVQDSDNNTTDGSLSDITEGTMLQITFDEEGNITEITVSQGMGSDMAGGQPGGQPGGSASGVDSYDAVTEYAEDTEGDGKSYSSTGTDENTILVLNGATVTLKNITVDRTSFDSTGGDNSSFYGVGAAVLTTDGTTYLKNVDITTNAAGGAGVFAYGDGTVYIADSDISTEKDTSGGIHAAGGGTLYAWDLNVETDGESSAAIRSDRGGGTMVVDGGTYTSNGTGSPAVYCTADIAVNNATLTANGSEAICMEGLNTIHLSDVDITYSDDSEFFLMCTGNTNERGWGTAGANGSDCTFTADNQDMEETVIWDSISDLDFYMTNGSTLTGYFVDDETYAGNGGDGYCSVYISDDSTWTVTGDSEITNLYNEGTIVDADGKTVSIVGTDGTVYVEGTSSYTITVEKYSDSADFSGAAEADSWTNHAVAKPEEIA